MHVRESLFSAVDVTSVMRQAELSTLFNWILMTHQRNCRYVIVHYAVECWKRKYWNTALVWFAKDKELLLVVDLCPNSHVTKLTKQPTIVITQHTYYHWKHQWNKSFSLAFCLMIMEATLSLSCICLGVATCLWWFGVIVE